MNDPAPEPSIAQLSAKIDDVVLGFRCMLACFLLLISIPNLCISLSIEHFHQIFQDALPGKTLPLLTIAVISCSTFLSILALAWPILGILNIYYAKRLQNWAISSVALGFLIGMQALLTWMACFLPLGNLLLGTPDTGVK